MGAVSVSGVLNKGEMGGTMDLITNFLRNENGEIYAIRQRVDHDDTLATIDVVAVCDNPDNAHDLVKQLNFRKKLYESVEAHHKKLEARLNKSYRTNSKLRRELHKLKKK